MRKPDHLWAEHPWLTSLILCIPVYILYACNFLGLPPPSIADLGYRPLFANDRYAVLIRPSGAR